MNQTSLFPRQTSERRVLWLTDLHLTSGMLYSRNPASQLDILMHHFRKYYWDTDLIVVTGDIAENGCVEQYRLLKDALTSLGIPALLTIGNHDDRENFFEVFPHERGEGDFSQRHIDIGTWRIICIDTVSPEGSKHSSYCSLRARWLDRCISQAAMQGQKCLIFMHHPPEKTQIAQAIDDTVLNSEELFRTLVRNRGDIEFIAFGHVHRAITGSWNGIPVCCNWATSHQTIYQAQVDTYCNDMNTSPRYGYLRLLESGVQAHLRSVEWEAAYRTVKSKIAETK